MGNKHWEEIINGKIAEAKQRGSRKRGWIKLDKTWLTSSINYRMQLDEIAVFSKLIVMADEFGPVAGLISDNDFRPMPYDYLAHQACCPLEVLETCLKKGIADDSIYENSHGIFLTHFDDYQFTEYDRQKPSRQARKERAREEAQTFEEYVEAIKPDYPNLDVDKELTKFELWWSEGNKELKRPKSAFRNWLEKGKVKPQNSLGKNAGVNRINTDDPNKYVKGKYGHMVRR